MSNARVALLLFWVVGSVVFAQDRCQPIRASGLSGGLVPGLSDVLGIDEFWVSNRMADKGFSDDTKMSHDGGREER